jgi:hypothetical protein
MCEKSLIFCRFLLAYLLQMGQTRDWQHTNWGKLGGFPHHHISQHSEQ